MLFDVKSELEKFVDTLNVYQDYIFNLEEEYNKEYFESLLELEKFLSLFFSYNKFIDKKTDYGLILLNRFYNKEIFLLLFNLKKTLDSDFVNILVDEYDSLKNILKNSFSDEIKIKFKNFLQFKKDLYKLVLNEFNNETIKSEKNQFIKNYSFEELLKDYIISLEEYIEELTEIEIESLNTISDDIINDIYRKTHSMKGNTAILLSFCEEDDIKNNVFFYLLKIYKNLEDYFSKIKDKKNIKNYEIKNIEKFEDFLIKSINNLKNNKFEAINEMTMFFIGGDEQQKEKNKKNIIIEIISSIKFQINLIEEGKDIKNPLQSIKRLLQVLKNEDQNNKEIIEDIIHEIEKSGFSVENYNNTISDKLKKIIKDYENKNKNLDSEPLLGQILIESGLITYKELEETLNQQKKLGEILIEKGYITKKELNFVLQKQKKIKESITQKDIHTDKKSVSDKYTVLKVEKKHLDILMNITGELIVYKNSLKSIFKDVSTIIKQKNNSNIKNFISRFREVSSNIEKLVDFLNITTSEMRLVDLRNLFTRYVRIVRDIEKKFNKSINFITEGEDTKLDKDIIDKIADPLMHIIRNACDHGIESKEERIKKNKSEKGLLKLSAYSKGAFVYIRVEDDGKGIDPDVILKKAIEKGLIKEEDSKKLTKDQILQFIFLPGFSTASKVTDISGRGVGMDVVKSSIESIGGDILLESYLNKGTTIILKIPVSISVTKGLLFSESNIKYFIPLEFVIETIKIKNQKIKIKNSQMFISLRNEVLPLFFFSSIIKNNLINKKKDNNDNDFSKIENYGNEKIFNTIILSVNGNRFGIIVDELYKEIDLKIKPLNQYFKNIKLISGVSILDDGSIVLALNPMNLAQRIIL